MYLTHKIKLYPTPDQEQYLLNACGVTRFAFNWAVDENNREYAETGKILGEFTLVKRFNAIRREKFPWTYDVTKWACQDGITRYAKAMDDFIAKIHDKPKHKARKNDESFYTGPDVLRIEGKRLQLRQGLRIRMAETVRFPGPVKFVIVKRENEDWFASVKIDVMPPYQYHHQCENQALSVGIDLGLKDYITLSTGEKIEAPKIGRGLEKRLAHAYRMAAKKQVGSANQKKAYRNVARIHKLIVRKRRDFINNLTSYLIKSYGFIAIENMSIGGFMRSRLAKSFADAAFGMFIKQLQYKAEIAGTVIHVIDKWYPSTKTCSTCNKVTGSSNLGIRKWTCSNCATTHDRDINAARNIAAEASRRSWEKNACGGYAQSRGSLRSSSKCKPMKQELASNLPM